MQQYGARTIDRFTNKRTNIALHIARVEGILLHEVKEVLTIDAQVTYKLLICQHEIPPIWQRLCI